jgi:hypothetical protein
MLAVFLIQSNPIFIRSQVVMTDASFAVVRVEPMSTHDVCGAEIEFCIFVVDAIC